MRQGERLTLTLTGGAPWGFRLQGGGHFPLEVAKIRKRSSAFDSDLKEGDLVLSINGFETNGKSHQSAMDVVDMAGDKIVFEVLRSSSSKGASRPLDPQRQPRIIPMVSGTENAGPGMVSTAKAKFSKTDGNTRTDINTEEYVMKAPGGKKITKTVTEQRVTRFPPSTSPVPPAYSQDNLQPGEHMSRPANRTPSRSPLMWQPTSSSPSDTRANISQSTSQQSMDQLRSPSTWQPPSRSPSDTRINISQSTSKRSSLDMSSRSPLMWQSNSRSPSDNRVNISQSHSYTSSLDQSRSPLMWQSQSRSPSDNRGEIPQRSRRHSSQDQAKSPLIWQPTSVSSSPVAPPGAHSAPGTSRKQAKKDGNNSGKENKDPIMASEQAKWEAQYGAAANEAKVSQDNYGYNTWGGRSNKRNNYVPKQVEDPNYPMFGVPTISWHAPTINEPEPDRKQKIPPPVPPKPTMNGSSSPIPFEDARRAVAGVNYHHPGMIPPPAQPNVKPAPPPPPMPPAPGPQSFGGLPLPRAFAPGKTSTPGKDEHDHNRPDHLPVFGPKVAFSPDQMDSGLALSPDRWDTHSDISSLAKTDPRRGEETLDDESDTSEKIFSDSAFYSDSSHKYPTIDEQMSMCKRIADSLTSAANTRARGARMFMKRKRTADKWVTDHNELYGFKSDYSSTTGDVADLQDLDSELFYDEGGAKPLFTFRIPKIAGQVTEGQKMSMSKEEFERMRLVAPRVDHHGVSPNVCFSIAADLQKGGKNRGARLFQKRQQRVEKFVIDESNVQKAPVDSRLNHMVQSPQASKPSPWSAAAQGNVQSAWDQRNGPRVAPQQMPVHYPRHDLSADSRPSKLQGDNFNRSARGWQSGPAHQQQSVYNREGEKPVGDENGDTLLLAIASPNEGPDQQNTHQRQRSPSPVDFDADPHAVQYGDYNRRMQAWSGPSGQATRPQPPPQQVYNYSAQPNYNSLPKGFSYTQPQSGLGACDL